MQHIQGEDRNQMFMFSLESAVPQNAFVRVVDAFVNAIDLKSFGFKHVECKEEGRPPYPPSALMKLYIYGYKNGIRSARNLEREARLNIEVMWLLSGLRPKYHTIADFRSQNKKAFRQIFRRFVYLLKEWELVEGGTVAIDSFKVRAQNSLKNNFNEKKIDRHITYIDEKISEYEQELDRNDKEDERKEIKKKIELQESKKESYKVLKDTLEARGEEQISLIDPDARAVVLHRNIVNVGYNIQTSVDAKHKLLVEYDTGDVNDTHALAPMARLTKQTLGVNCINILADKGYHTGEQLRQCCEEGVTTYVSPKELSTQYKEFYPFTMFQYNKETDTYTCPAGKVLSTNGKWYRHSERRKGRIPRPYYFKRYQCNNHKQCAHRKKCTSSKHNGRYIDRSEYSYVIEANNKRVNQNPEYYRQRQLIAEHMFGTLKRQRGFTHMLVRGKENVLSEIGLMFIGYNLTRCATIFGVKKLIKLLKEYCLCIFNLVNRPILSLNNEVEFLNLKTAA
jgi:transposase